MIDITIEDIEQTPHHQETIREREISTHKESDDWNTFQAQFQSVFDSSDAVVQEATLAGQIQKLKDELAIKALESLQQVPEDIETHLQDGDDK